MSEMAAVTTRPIRSILRTISMRGRACRTSRFDKSSVKMPHASARQMSTTSRGAGTASARPEDPQEASLPPFQDAAYQTLDRGLAGFVGAVGLAIHPATVAIAKRPGGTPKRRAFLAVCKSAPYSGTPWNPVARTEP